MKTFQENPDFFQLANITSIYKKKGDSKSLDNYRGIFTLMTIRSILERLIYNDNYEGIDEEMSESNVGARQNRNIRDHLFVLYGVINDIQFGTGEDAHLHVYDIVKCFDKMWLKEVLNDLYDAKMNNDQLSLLYNLNKTTKVAVKTNKVVINAAFKAKLRANNNRGSSSCQTVTTEIPDILSIVTGSAKLAARTGLPK